MKRKLEQPGSESKRVRCEKERRVRLQYVQCAGASRLGLLGKLMLMKRKKGSDLRVAVIFKSERACQFHSELFRALRFPTIQLLDNDDVMPLPSNVRQQPMSTEDDNFQGDGGLWFLTEADGGSSKVKDIDYLVIFDPVESVESLQRLLQLCKSDGTATSLVFLHQQEVGLLPLLAEQDLEHREVTISKNTFNNIIQQANKTVKSSFLISQTAQGAYKAFIAVRICCVAFSCGVFSLHGLFWWRLDRVPSC